MPIKDHKLTNTRYVRTKHMRGPIDPTLVVVHESGTRIEPGKCVRYCQSNSRKVCYHVIIERDGEIVQMAPFNRRVNHAGRSVWKGRQWSNNYAVGVALVGPTELSKSGKKSFWGEKFPNAVQATSPFHGTHWWLDYTLAQRDALHVVLQELKHAYPDIDIAGHYEVSPGRKIDPSPLINLDEYRSKAVSLEPIVVDRPAPTPKVLRKTSKKYQSTDVAKKITATGVILGGAKKAGEYFGLDTINSTKTYMDAVNGVITTYGLEITVIVLVGWFLYFQAMQRWQEQDYDEGRYEPSGEESSS